MTVHPPPLSDKAVVPDSPFRGFFESLAVGAVQISPGGDFLEVNARFCALTGYPRQRLLSMRVADLDHPDDRPTDQDRWGRFLADPGVGYDVEKRYVRADGETIWVHVTGALIRYQGDKPLIAKTVEEITDRVRANLALRESEERMRDALALKEQLLGFVSHELRTPLTIVVGLADVMARGRMSLSAMRSTARELRESSEHLASLLESMLLLAQADNDGGTLREPVILVQLARRVAKRHRKIHPERQIHVVDRSDGAMIEAHEPWIEQVLHNLLGNAEKYSPSGTDISIELGIEHEVVTARVLDDGPGIAPREVPLIFEAFYRATETRGSTTGLGLGLAVCKRLVELHGGRIWVQPRDGRGSEFGFALPRLRAGE